MITINPEKLVRNVNTGGDFIFRGGLALQAELGIQNATNYAKFLTTPKGLQFAATQTILQSFNPYPATKNYNPLAPVQAKALSQEFTQNKPTRHTSIGVGGLIGGALDKFKGPERKSNQTDAITYFSKGETDASIQVRYGGQYLIHDSLPNRRMAFSGIRGGYDSTRPKDLIKFKIRDAINGKWIIFPAFLGGITDNSTATYTDYSYIGRPDKVYVYSGYSRSINFNIDVVATRRTEVPIIWEKVNYAKGLTLPHYKPFFSKSQANGGGQEDSTRPVAPLVYLTLGDLFNNTPGFFESVNMSIPESSTWELEDGRQVPHICQLTFQFTYVGKYNPTMTSAHYGDITKTFPMGDPSIEDRVAKFNNSPMPYTDFHKQSDSDEYLDGLTFNEAFKLKREELGAGKTFTWKGKSYSTNLAGEN